MTVHVGGEETDVGFFLGLLLEVHLHLIVLLLLGQVDLLPPPVYRGRCSGTGLDRTADGRHGGTETRSSSRGTGTGTGADRSAGRLILLNAAAADAAAELLLLCVGSSM